MDRPLVGFPDLDTLTIGNILDKSKQTMNGLTYNQRRTYFSFYVLTGVPMYLGDDMEAIDQEYKDILTHPEMLRIHDDWTSRESPAFYVASDGSRNPDQLQILVAGPFDDRNEVIVMLANMGQTESINRWPVPWMQRRGRQNVVAKFDMLQLSESYCVRDVWAGTDTGRADTQVSRELDEGESVVFRLTPQSKAPGLC
jgi:hypothetical protein